MAGGREQARGDSLTFEILGSRQGLVTKSQAARDAARSLAKSSSTPSPRASPIYVLDSGSTATIRAEPASPYDAIQPVLKVSSANRKASTLSMGVPASSSGPLVPTSHSSGGSPHAGGISTGGYFGSSQLSSSTSAPSPTALVGGRPLSARGAYSHGSAAGLAAATYLSPGTAQHAATASGGAQPGVASSTNGSSAAAGRRPSSAPLQMYMSHGSGMRAGSAVPALSAAVSQLGQGPGHVASVPSALTAIAGSQGTRHGSLGTASGSRLTRSQSARESSLNHSLAGANGSHVTGPVRPLSASVAQGADAHSNQQPRPASAGSLQPHAPSTKQGSSTSSGWVASVRNRLLGVRAAGSSKEEAQQSPRQRAGSALARSLSAGAALGSSLDTAVEGSKNDLLMRMFQHLQGTASPASPTEVSGPVLPLSGTSSRQQVPGSTAVEKGSGAGANTSSSNKHVSTSNGGSTSTSGISPHTGRLPSGSATGPSNGAGSPSQPQASTSITPSAPGGSAPQTQRPGRAQQQQQQQQQAMTGPRSQPSPGGGCKEASSSAVTATTVAAPATTARPGTPALTTQQLSKQQHPAGSPPSASTASSSSTPQVAVTAVVTPERPGSGRKQLSLDMSKIKNPLEAGGARIVALSSSMASSAIGSPGGHSTTQGSASSPAASSSSPSPSARAARLEATVSPLAAKAATTAKAALRAGGSAVGGRGFRHEGPDEGGVRASLTFVLFPQGAGFEVPVPLVDIGTSALLPGGVYAAAAQRSSKVMCDVMAGTSELAAALGLNEAWIARAATSRASF